MKRFGCLFSLVIFGLCSSTGQQVRLNPWLQRYGQVPYQNLGKFVGGIPPNPNIPYRAVVSNFKTLEFYRLQNQQDTIPQLILPGHSLVTGDLNSDGWLDAVVAVTTNNANDTVYVYWGTPSGLDTLHPLVIPDEQYLSSLDVGCIGDMNNDGRDDLVLRAPDWGRSYGKVYVYLNPVHSPIPDATATGDSVYDSLFGVATAIGDLNDDGFNELIVRGDSQAGQQSEHFDYLDIFWGVAQDSLDLTHRQFWRAPMRSGTYGLACFDVTGDGKDDLMWRRVDSYTNEGNYIGIYAGSANFDTVASLKLEDVGGDFGWIIINGGDMNGDGYSEVATSCPVLDRVNSIVLVFGGGPGMDGVFDAAVSMSMNARFGHCIASLGDVTGDGLADIIIGAVAWPFYENRGYWAVCMGDRNIHVTSVSPATPHPRHFKLLQAYPNPFNPTTTIEYELEESGFVTLQVIDIAGRVVRTLVHEQKAAGRHTAEFNGANLSSGTYLYRITVMTHTGERLTETRSATLLK